MDASKQRQQSVETEQNWDGKWDEKVSKRWTSPKTLKTNQKKRKKMFLWSVQNLCMAKANLSEPPDNDIFDCFAQIAMRQLDKSETSTEGKPKE
jgi:hypothetical protein